MNIFDQYRQDHVFKDRREELQFRLACVDWVARAEYFFKSPLDLDKPLHLYPSQKRVGHAVQYGTDPRHPNWGEKKGILCTAGRQLMGKSTGCAAIAAAGMLDGMLRFGLFAHVEDKSFELMNKLSFFLVNSPFKHMIKQKSKQKLTLTNNSFAQTHAASSSIEGGSFHYCLIDEAGWMEDRVVQMHILPTTRKIGKRWVMLGTPKGMRGVFYLFYERSKRDIIAGASPKYHIIHMDPVEDGILTAQELQDEVDSGVAGIWARQELLGEFISAEDLFFSEAMIEYAMGNIEIEGVRHRGTPYANSWNNRKIGALYSLGMDFGLVHSMTVFCVARKPMNSNLIYIDFIRAFKDATEYLPILERLNNKWLPYWKPRYVVPDGSGIGRTNCELIRKMVRGHAGVNLFNNKPNDEEKIGFIMGDPYTKQELFQNLKRLFEDRLIVLPSHLGAVYKDQPGFDMYELKRELCNLQYEARPKYVLFESASESVLTDRIVALALAVYPFKELHNRLEYRDPHLAYHGYQTYREPSIYDERKAFLERFDEFGRGDYNA